MANFSESEQSLIDTAKQIQSIGFDVDYAKTPEEKTSLQANMKELQDSLYTKMSSMPVDKMMDFMTRVTTDSYPGFKSGKIDIHKLGFGVLNETSCYALVDNLCLDAHSYHRLADTKRTMLNNAMSESINSMERPQIEMLTEVLNDYDLPPMDPQWEQSAINRVTYNTRIVKDLLPDKIQNRADFFQALDDYQQNPDMPSELDPRDFISKDGFDKKRYKESMEQLGMNPELTQDENPINDSNNQLPENETPEDDYIA